MISKKSRKVVAVLLIGATVCASGTFAYFNSKVDLNNTTGLADSAKKTLDITNGTVEITSKFSGTTGATLGGAWSYDITRNSNASGTTVDKTFIQKHRSPDITIEGADAEAKSNANGLDRVKVGTPITGAVTKVRPGDAFYLGVISNADAINDDDKADVDISTANGGGIEIVNKSNLTTKLGMRLKTTKSGSDAVLAQKEQLAALTAMGCKVYFRMSPKTTGGSIDYTTWKELDLTDFGTISNKGVVTDLKIYEIGNVGAVDLTTNPTGTSVAKLEVRVELPLITGNNKKGMSNLTNGSTAIDGFNLLDLFEVVATQENNPGWTQSGTTPTLDEPFTDKDSADADRN